MAKKRSKKKLPLSRGRGKNMVGVSTSASETDLETGEDRITTDAEGEVVTSSGYQRLEDSSASATSSTAGGKEKDKDLMKKNGKKSTTETEKEEDDDEGYRKIPNLLNNIKFDNDERFNYITNDPRHRQFELNARKNLLMKYQELEIIRTALDSALNLTRKLYPDVRKGNVADANKTLDFPKTAKELCVGLFNVPTSNGRVIPLISIPEPIFEESEEELEKYLTPQQNSKTPRLKFPSPTKMTKFTTPKQNDNGIFYFGSKNKAGMLSTNKAPRLPKPGEVVYSQGGSPILQRRIPDVGGPDAKAFERIEILGEDGQKIEVDMVYRGNQDVNKMRGFKEFAKDVRGFATSRSTVKQNRVQPPRVNAMKGTSLSASKKKPEWR